MSEIVNPNIPPGLTVQKTNEKIIAHTTDYEVKITNGGVVLKQDSDQTVINTPQDTGIVLKVRNTP